MRKNIAYDPASGAIAGVCNLSPSQAEAWEALGLTVAEAGSMDPEGVTLSPETHNFIGGVLAAKTLVSLTPDKTEIIADGQDQAVVGVSLAGEEPPESIELSVGGQSEVVALAGGQGALSPISAATPCTVVVDLADTVAYRGDPAVIVAVSND